MSNEYLDLSAALRSNFPILVIESHDEERALRLLRKSIADDPKLGQLQLWSPASGLEHGGAFSASELKVEGIDYPAHRSAANLGDPEAMLLHVKDKVSDSIVVLPDFHAYLGNPTILRLVKEIAQQYYVRHTTLVLLSHAIEVPSEISRLCTHYELELPSALEIEQIILDDVRSWQARNTGRCEVDRKAIKLLAQNLVGLTYSDTRRLARNAIQDDGAITHSDLDEVMETKYRMISNDGALNYEFDTASFTQVGGFAKLKSWLEVRKPFFLGQAGGNTLDIPRGMLLLGVQGCGKSLAAKAVAGSWGVPLLRLDVGALYNKYIGESEKNLRDAIRSAETLEPCVLWLDEIEKAIQGSGDDTGTSNRLLGTLLTWMAENKARVFIVATSNDIDKLPPELMRKGRLDEIFFVDLPREPARRAIIGLHLKRREYAPEQFDIAKLAALSDGFSGAELEQAIVAARYQSHADQQSLSTLHIEAELQATQPLSVVRAAQVQALRNWAADRTVSVD